MSRTQGYYVRLWRQGIDGSDEGSDARPEYIMDGDVPQLFMTAADANEAGQEFTADRPDLTHAIEPVVP